MHNGQIHTRKARSPSIDSSSLNRYPARLLAVLVATSLLAMGLAAITAADEEPPIEDDRDYYDSIQDALDELHLQVDQGDADEDPAVIVSASSNDDPTPFLEALTIRTDGITLCNAAATDGQDPGPIYIGVTSECADDSADRAVIDAATKGPVIMDIQADDVTVKGFTLRWVVSPQRVTGIGTSNPADLANQGTGLEDSIRGIVAGGDNIRIEDNEIRIRVGPAPFLASSPSPLPGTGVVIPAGSTGVQVVNNDIRVIRGTEGTIGGSWGIVASGAEYLIKDNVVKQWAFAGIRVTDKAESPAGVIANNTLLENGLYGVHLDQIEDPEAVPLVTGNTFWTQGDAAVFIDRSHGAIIDGNGIQPGLAVGSGVWVRGADDVQLTNNEFSAVPSTEGQKTGFPVKVSGGPQESPDVAPEGLLLRHNHFRLDEASLNQFALHVTSDVQLTHIDARMNDWDVCDWGEVSARIMDAGVTNTIDVTPFVTSDC